MSGLPFALALAASVLALIGLFVAVAGWRSLRRGRRSAGLLSALSGLLLVLLGVVGWGAVLGTRGYRALTREERAATVTTTPVSPQVFRAVVRVPDAAADTFRIAGDQLYVDAQILKWHPWANLLGIHTGYQLTRIGGRYRSIEDERSRERTVYPLTDDPAVELFRVVADLPLVSAVVDATYGSAAFVPAAEGGVFEVRVTTSGLLMRRRPGSGRR